MGPRFPRSGSGTGKSERPSRNASFPRFSRHSREGGNPCLSSTMILDPRLRGDDGGLTIVCAHAPALSPVSCERGSMRRKLSNLVGPSVGINSVIQAPVIVCASITTLSLFHVSEGHSAQGLQTLRARAIRKQSKNQPGPRAAGTIKKTNPSDTETIKNPTRREREVLIALEKTRFDQAGEFGRGFFRVCAFGGDDQLRALPCGQHQ